MGWAVARARPEQNLLNRLLLPASEDSPASLAGGSGQRWGGGGVAMGGACPPRPPAKVAGWVLGKTLPGREPGRHHPF